MNSRSPEELVMKKTFILFFTLCCLCTAEQDIINSQPEGQHPPSPEEAVAMITLPEGFKATLFAGEPDVHQPIAMAFDDRGRLWIAESYIAKHDDPAHPIKVVDGKSAVSEGPGLGVTPDSADWIEVARF